VDAFRNPKLNLLEDGSAGGFHAHLFEGAADIGNLPQFATKTIWPAGMVSGYEFGSQFACGRVLHKVTKSDRPSSTAALDKGLGADITFSSHFLPKDLRPTHGVSIPHMSITVDILRALARSCFDGRVHPAPYQHELDGAGSGCTSLCPACLWVQEGNEHTYFSLVLAQIAAKMIMMELDDLLLTKREAIGPAVLELTWIHRQLRDVPEGTATISINQAATALGKDKRTVSRNFRRLENVGLLKREARAGRSHLYQLQT